MVAVMFALAVLSAAGAVYLVRKRWRFTDTPTSDAAHVFPGLSEVHGTVESVRPPVIAASDGAPCVWWQYKVERKQKDSKGNSRWVTEELGITADPFLVRDRSGAVMVVVDENAQVRSTDTADIEHLALAQLRPRARVMRATYEPGALGQMFSGLFGSNEADEPISEFGGSWRATESRLRVGQSVFITAHARITPRGDAVELSNVDAKGDKCTFELSLGDEKAAMSTFSSPFAIAAAITASFVFGAVAGHNADKGGSGVWLVPLVLAIAAAVLWLIGSWNRVRRARERGHFAWSLIDVACEQRSLTVPQVQAVVGAALAHEQSLLVAVAAARDVGRTPSSAGAAAVQHADTAAAQVVARVEATPSLHTQANVAQLMQQLQLLNDRVAFGRRFYNDSVERLANRLHQFPDSLIARLAKVELLPRLD